MADDKQATTATAVPTDGEAGKVIDGEVAVVTATGPVAIDHVGMVERGREFWKLKAALLLPSDIQSAKGAKFVTASGYDKLGAALGLSEQVLGADEHADEHGQLTHCRVHVRVTAEGTTRSVEGIGIAEVKGGAVGGLHDAMATAHTRARKRAIDSFIGGVDASEVKAR